MLALQNISRNQQQELASILAEGFKNNDAFQLWGDTPGERKKVLTKFFNLNLNILLEKNLVFATSDQFEGVCGFWTKDSLRLKDKMKLLKLVTFLPFSRLLNIRKQRKKLKRSEALMKHEADYLFIFMVVVQKQYRGQGHMRKMMEFMFDYARKRNIPCVLETDSKRNEEIYHHYGMETISKQSVDE